MAAITFVMKLLSTRSPKLRLLCKLLAKETSNEMIAFGLPQTLSSQRGLCKFVVLCGFGSSFGRRFMNIQIDLIIFQLVKMHYIKSTKERERLKELLLESKN